MTDQLDRAGELEQRHRDAALKAATQKRQMPAQIHDAQGRVVCLECEDAIPQARLDAQPGTPWCVECKTRTDRKKPHVHL